MAQHMGAEGRLHKELEEPEDANKKIVSSFRRAGALMTEQQAVSRAKELGIITKDTPPRVYDMRVVLDNQGRVPPGVLCFAGMIPDADLLVIQCMFPQDEDHRPILTKGWEDRLHNGLLEASKQALCEPAEPAAAGSFALAASGAGPSLLPASTELSAAALTLQQRKSKGPPPRAASAHVLRLPPIMRAVPSTAPAPAAADANGTSVTPAAHHTVHSSTVEAATHLQLQQPGAQGAAGEIMSKAAAEQQPGLVKGLEPSASLAAAAPAPAKPPADGLALNSISAAITAVLAAALKQSSTQQSEVLSHATGHLPGAPEAAIAAAELLAAMARQQRAVADEAEATYRSADTAAKTMENAAKQAQRMIDENIAEQAARQEAAKERQVTDQAAAEIANQQDVCGSQGLTAGRSSGQDSLSAPSRAEVQHSKQVTETAAGPAEQVAAVAQPNGVQVPEEGPALNLPPDAGLAAGLAATSLQQEPTQSAGQISRAGRPIKPVLMQDYHYGSIDSPVGPSHAAGSGSTSRLGAGAAGTSRAKKKAAAAAQPPPAVIVTVAAAAAADNAGPAVVAGEPDAADAAAAAVAQAQAAGQPVPQDDEQAVHAAEQEQDAAAPVVLPNAGTAGEMPGSPPEMFYPSSAYMHSPGAGLL